MRRFETIAYARAGLVGNPSDGYFGKTISFVIRNFSARVVIYEWPTLEILPSQQDLVRFENLDELAEDVRLNGYYGGLRLVKASLKKFHEYCVAHRIELPDRNFTIRYDTNVPRQVGLAGSSAIITAAFRALMKFYDVEIPPEILANWVLGTEVNELGIQAGLQDRVCQAYEGLVYMDFARPLMESRGYGEYSAIDPSLLPTLYVAYRVDLSQISDVVHSDLRGRWNQGDPEVVDAMKAFADLTDRANVCLVERRPKELPAILDANFDLRRKIVPISDANLAMIETARRCGASAKFAGSGGAIVGTCPDEKVYGRLSEELGRIGCRVIKPVISLPESVREQ